MDDKYLKLYLPLKELEDPIFDEKTIKKLMKLKINSIYELFYYFPRSYDNRNNIKKISQLQNNEYSVVKGEVTAINISSTSTGKKLVKVKIKDETGFMELVWYSAPYIAKAIKFGEEYYFIGVSKMGFGLQMTNPEFKKIDSQKKAFSGEILPIYSTTKEFSQNHLRDLIKKALSGYLRYLDENIPKEILDKYKMTGRKKAIEEIHFPTGEVPLEAAQRRFAAEELLILLMGILSSRYSSDSENHSRYKLEDKKHLVQEFLRNMKFELTKSQKKVITDVYKELIAGKISNRLIQGDVGSGKTVVSMILLLYMVENGYQGAIMAPTEILATQHYLGNYEEFKRLGIVIELLTGSLTQKKKNELLQRIENGEVHIVVGTHALIQENVKFQKLGLIVIDEQHRFGVEQRKSIRDKGVLANLIVMSATPIPRSLALSIYGDLDVSVISELPPGRKEIRTKYIAEPSDENKMYTFINKILGEGRQAYFIAPLIDESEKLSSKSVMELAAEVEKRLPGFRIGILHGKMSSKDKDQVMHSFKNHELDIIVSTTVIEVGVNVPNSTVIVISDAERFGLSSLHQLRGRVGRGDYQSYCFLISKSENENSILRMKVMESTSDGFKIAEEDLKLRKPGEIFGTKQSGVSDLKFTDIVHDVRTIELVRNECIEYLKNNKGKISQKTLEIDIAQKFDMDKN